MLRNPFVSLMLHPNSDSRNRHNASRRQSRLNGTHPLRVEALEDRRLLAVTVGNNGDVVNGDVSTVASLVADDGGDGISLREAITASNNTAGADQIEFAPGVRGTISLTHGQLNVTDELTINGPGKGELTVSGSGLSRILNVSDTSLAVHHLTIADGFTTTDLLPPSFGTAGGAGIRATNSTVSLEQVVLTDNRIVDSVFAAGAAIQARGQSIVNLDHVAVRNNEASGLFFAIGGAIQSDQGSTLVIEHSTFDGNRAANHPVSPFTVGGGAIGTSGGGQTTINHSRFTGNQVDGGGARGLGGAIHNTFGSSLVIDNSGFRYNSAVGATAGGGAIANDSGGSSIISNSYFVHNSTVAAGTAQGGALWNTAGGTMAIENSSLVNNQAIGTDALGGGIYSVGGTAVTMKATNVNSNRAIGGSTGIGGGVYSDDGTFDVDKSSNIQGNEASTSHDEVFGNLTLLDGLLALA